MSEPVSSSKPAANLQEEQKATLPSPKPVVIVAADILEEGELPQPDPEVQSEGLPEEEPIVEGGEEDKGAASEGEEGPHLGKKKKKKKSKAIKKLFMTFKGLVKKKAERGQTLHPIEKCFLEGNWIMTYKKDKNTLLIRLLQKHFKEKHNELYKSERDTADLPHDFSSTKGVPVKVSKINQKYYEKRYYLFSKFDEGIELDEESTMHVRFYLRLVLGDAGGDRGLHCEKVQEQVCPRRVLRGRRELHSGISFRDDGNSSRSSRRECMPTTLTERSSRWRGTTRRSTRLTTRLRS